MSVSRQGGRRLPQPAHNQRGRWTRRRKKGNLFDDSNPRQVIAWDSGVPLLGLSALRTSWALPRTFCKGMHQAQFRNARTIWFGQVNTPSLCLEP